MYGYSMDKNGNATLFAYPASGAFCMHQGATPDGKLIVGYYMASGFARGYLLSDDGTVTTFNVPGALSTSAMDMNAAGLVVGVYRDAAMVQHGFAVDTKLSMDTSTWAYTYPIDPSGSTKTYIRGVNTRGDIVGDYIQNGVTHGFVGRRGPK